MNTGIWRGAPPALTSEGQTAFWDEQADRYETADMTNDNKAELDIVLQQSRDVSCADIVTLGGAVGCRDPKALLEDMWIRGQKPPRVIIFNDLSERLTRKATEVLRPYAMRGSDIVYVPGPIASVCERIERRPRRLVLGVYRDDALFKADPDNGYPLAGFEEYLKNHAIVGSELHVGWVVLTSENEIQTADGYQHVRCDDNAERMLLVKHRVQRKPKVRADERLLSLRVIGTHPDRPGFFLSHWYTAGGILELVRRTFPEEHFAITLSQCPKGMVLTIDPVGVRVNGVVTVLNNVLGNVLPQDQHETLMAIRGIMS